MFEPGQRVERLEDRPQVAATVLEVTPAGAALIAYDEGGQGWWPVECLSPIDQQR